MWQNITIQIKSSEKACGESNISLLGHELESVWDGSSATGEHYFPDIFPPILAEWQILCFYDTGSHNSGDINGRDITQVLSFGIRRTRKDLNVGFTVSYKQVGAPTVLQFSPRSSERKALESNAEHWRTPSPAFIPHEQPQATGEEYGVEEDKDDDEVFVGSGNNRQKTLVGSLGRVTHYVKQQLTSLRETAAKVVQSCHTHLKEVGSKIHETIKNMCPKHRQKQEIEDVSVTTLAESPPIINHPLKVSPDRPIDALPPAQTRSLHTSIPTPSSSTHAAPYDSTPLGLHSPPTAAHFVKLVSLAVLLFSGLTYIIYLIRDPRRRADRAARCEERRNRHLYRRAAWAHWWQTRICAIRHRHCPRSRGTGTCESWDEKRAKVIEQEDILEAVAQQDIRTLRHATRPSRNRHVSSIAAAEEGRNGFYYDSESESSERRRRRQSLITLPGYESEGTQPPGYTTVNEDTPDSSVVSTSPRISRDGFGGLADSDDGKSIEEFSLNATRAVRHDLRRVF